MFFYVHIPFCRQRCTYCKFALSPMVKEAQVGRYVACLRREIRGFFANGDRTGSRDRIESVYFGGGTPSVLSPERIADILSEFPIDLFSPNAEICLEANPEDISPEWSEGVFRLGINRISLGVQTLNPESLTAIGRSRPESVGIALGILSATGYPNVNVDFILGLPHVKPGETLRDIRSLHEKFPKIRHASVYFLEK